MKIRNRFVALAALTALACTSVPAFAEDHGYTEGMIVNAARIRTVDGKFDDYMKWLDTNWKKQQEIAKKEGYLVSYEVLQVEPRTPDDPDLILIRRYKNWAALDGALARSDKVAEEVNGSVAASNKAQTERAAIRRVLGSSTMQVLDLK
jgi:hypothetical protein